MEDAEARRVSLVHVFDRLDHQHGEPDQTQSWIDTLKARMAIQRVRFSSLSRSTLLRAS
jgi:hypothetical protein